MPAQQPPFDLGFTRHIRIWQTAAADAERRAADANRRLEEEVARQNRPTPQPNDEWDRGLYPLTTRRDGS